MMSSRTRLNILSDRKPSQVEMYSALVERTFGVGLEVQSWRRGIGAMRSSCPPATAHESLNARTHLSGYSRCSHVTLRAVPRARNISLSGTWAQPKRRMLDSLCGRLMQALSMCVECAGSCDVHACGR